MIIFSLRDLNQNKLLHSIGSYNDYCSMLFFKQQEAGVSRHSTALVAASAQSEFNGNKLHLDTSSSSL